MKPLLCDHDNTKLTPEQTPKSGTIYRCKKCGCTYRLIIVRNDKDCYNKRYPHKEKKP